METITSYKKKIWTYKKRRQRNYEINRRLSNRIRSMEACLAAREAREKKSKEKVDKLLSCVNYYFSLDIRDKINDAQHRFAKYSFYKAGIEMQLRQTLLLKAIKRSDKPSYGRTVLNKSFNKDPAKEELYYGFKRYLELCFKKNKVITKKNKLCHTD